MAKREMIQEPTGGGGNSAYVRRFSAEVLGSESVVPVVLEFEQPPVAVYKSLNPQADAARYEAELAAMHQEFIRRLAATGVDIQVGKSSAMIAGPEGQQRVSLPHDFTHVFNGIGVLIPGRVVAQLAGLAGVRAITLNEERVYLNLDHSVPFTGAPRLWERLDAAGVNVRGDGVVVAVIDTGIDHTHPVFGGYTEVPNEKVLLSVSYTGEHPIDNFGHGTHVAGIIAADAEYKGTPRGDALLGGMAPKAKLMGYKVLSASGSGSATNIILAMEDAVRRGVHVMNLSLGDSMGDPLSPESSAANNAMLAGVVVCIAAGNSGPESSSIGAPGAAHNVITVGASTDDGVTVLVAELTAANGEPRILEMRMMDGSVSLPWPALESAYVACGMGLKEKDFPAEVRDRIALIERGEITFREKAVAAEKAGAIACVIYNNRDGGFFGSLGEEEGIPKLPVISISKADGALMLKAFDPKQVVSSARLRLDPEQVPQPDHLAEFSSRGPNRDGWIKPELTAPGVNITSATILQAAYPGGGMPDPSGYTTASGTSMATPHIAGACALIRQAHPDWSPLRIKAALVNTARLMVDQGGVMEQGNGALDLLRAVDCRAILVTATTPICPTHSFGKLVHEGQAKSVSQPLVIQPLVQGEEPSSYRLAVELIGRPDGLQAELAPGTTICAGETMASFNLTVTVDGERVTDGAYYGYVTAEASWGTLRLPFYVVVSRYLRAEPAPAAQAGKSHGKPEPRRRIGAMPIR